MSDRAHLGHLVTVLLIALLGGFGLATAQSLDAEWEYLVVSYGTTYFSDPLLEADASDATFSKVQLFSDLGVTLPNEAISLQRNIDILGRFGWELVTVVGTIGGDQQLVFKRPYDEQRSADEAARIRAEREELIAAYNEARSDTSSTEQTPELVDLDAVERAQATDARNRRDEATVRSAIEAAAAHGSSLVALDVEGRAYSPEAAPRVYVRVTQDVTGTALVGPGQYRRSLVDTAVEGLFEALGPAGLSKPRYGFCLGDDADGEVNITVTAVLQHGGTTTAVGNYTEVRCF